MIAPGVMASSSACARPCARLQVEEVAEEPEEVVIVQHSMQLMRGSEEFTALATVYDGEDTAAGVWRFSEEYVKPWAGSV